MSQNDLATPPDRDVDRNGGLISVLEEIQARYGYLPEQELRRLAAETNRSLVDIYGVATFFRAFSLKPRGKHLVSACLGTACHVRGGPTIAKELETQLGIKAGDTTRDKEFTLETVNCLGACALGPVVVVDGHYFSKVRLSMVKGILDRTRSGLDSVDVLSDRRVFPLEINCARCNHGLMDADHAIDGQPSIHFTISAGNRLGQLHLSSLYGSPNACCELEIAQGTLAKFYCPHCQSELTGGPPCGECEAPIVTMLVNGGGIQQICSRRGCKAHMLDLNGVNLWPMASDDVSNVAEARTT
jgi:NADH:ubiquinone oxidoreductase subunit E